MSDELDQSDDNVFDRAMEVAEAEEAEEDAKTPVDTEAATEEATGEQEAPQSEDATPTADQGLDKSIAAEPEPKPDTGSEHPLLSAVPEELREEMKSLLDMKANYDKRGAEWNREHQARLAAEKDLGTYREVAPDPSQLREEVRRAREYQEKINTLPPWHSHHPHHASYMDLIRRGQDVASRVQDYQTDASLDDETRNRLIAKEVERLSPEDRQHLEGYRQARDQWNLNPMGNTMASIDQAMSNLPQMVRAEFAKLQEETAARQEVRTFLSEQKDDSLMPEMRAIMMAQETGDQFSVVRKFADLSARLKQLEDENRLFRDKFGKTAEMVAHSEAQIEATKQRAVKTPVAKGGGAGMSKEDLAKALASGSLVEAITGRTD